MKCSIFWNCSLGFFVYLEASDVQKANMNQQTKTLDPDVMLKLICRKQVIISMFLMYSLKNSQ